MRAFGGADAATLADGQIDVEPCGPLHHALHGAVKPALRALDAFGSIDHGPHAAPVAGEHGAGPGRDRTQVVRNRRLVEEIVGLPLFSAGLLSLRRTSVA